MNNFPEQSKSDMPISRYAPFNPFPNNGSLTDRTWPSKTKEMFLANMSHEIRTPLNVILGMTRLIMKEDLNERLSEYVKHSQYAANHLLSIINDILDLSKIEFGEMNLQLNQFNLYTLSNAIESIFTPNAEEKGLGKPNTRQERKKEYILTKKVHFVFECYTSRKTLERQGGRNWVKY